ncbi:MAG: hypothetical protein Kow0099_08990 [Candidatus Abyssubacteria bacterium]
MERLRSPHVKLQEFLDCFLETDYRKELKRFDRPESLGAVREEDTADEALRYLALVLLYAIDEKAKDIVLATHQPHGSVVKMSGDRFYELPLVERKVLTTLFDEIEEMTGMNEDKRTGKLVVGLRDSEIDLNVTSKAEDSGERKILIQLPQIS